MAESKKTAASEEQIAYANVLNIGMWAGFFLLVISFLVYISGALPTFVPIEELPKYWGMNVHDFNEALHAPTGWGWLSLVGKGDYLNFIGVAILAGLTVVCYLVILPIFTRKKDRAYAIIAVVEVLVLALAASGILKAGGH